MVQPMDRGLRLFEYPRDLSWAETAQVPQDQDLPLLVRQTFERLSQIANALGAELFSALLVGVELLHRH